MKKTKVRICDLNTLINGLFSVSLGSGSSPKPPNNQATGKRSSKKKKAKKQSQQQNMVKKEKRDDSPSPPMNREEMEEDVKKEDEQKDDQPLVQNGITSAADASKNGSKEIKEEVVEGTGKDGADVRN